MEEGLHATCALLCIGALQKIFLLQSRTRPTAKKGRPNIKRINNKTP
jgi:hypothetical protein